MKPKIKSYGDEARNFHDEEIYKAGSDYICLVVSNVDSGPKKNENYCPQVFLKECNYIKKVVIRYITEDIEVCPSDSDVK